MKGSTNQIKNSVETVLSRMDEMADRSAVTDKGVNESNQIMTR